MKAGKAIYVSNPPPEVSFDWCTNQIHISNKE